MQARLITIPISHYCERARWALEYAGISYREERHLQGFHYFHSLRVGSATVPILFADNQVFSESAAIVRWADSKLPDAKRLYSRNRTADDQEFESSLENEFGKVGRLWMYTYMFDQLDLFMSYSRKHDVPRFQITALPLVFNFIKPFARKRLQWEDNSRETTKASVDRILNLVSKRLQAGQPYLSGEKFGGLDLTFASLAAPVVLPENYGVELPKLDELPHEMAEQIIKWRSHKAGEFALRLYAEHRNVR